MKSSAENRLLNLDRDLPTTREDTLALRSCRVPEKPDLAEYIRFLESLPADESSLAAVPGPHGDAPFEL